MSFDHSISRRSVFKGAGGLAAASALGAGAALGVNTPAHAAGLEVIEHQTYGRMEYYKVSTPSIAWKPRINVLLPDGYDSGRRYPVLYLLHGGAQNFMKFDKEDDIRGLTAGRDLIVVMPDGGIAGWYCNPVTANLGPRNWETFHIEELIPWVDATFRTFPEQAGRAVSGFSMRLRSPQVHRQVLRPLRLRQQPLRTCQPAKHQRRGRPLGECQLDHRPGRRHRLRNPVGPGPGQR